MRADSRLRRAFDRVRSEPGLTRNVLVVLVLILLAGVSGGVILSNQRFTWPWDDKFVFHATFEHAPGVSPNHGQEVRIAGVSVGEIRDMTVDDQGNARLTLAIEPGHPVHHNATVVLRPKSPLNEMYVELSPGTPESRELAAEDTLAVTNSQRPIQVDEVLAHLDDNTREALTALLAEADTALAAAPHHLPGGLTATDRVLGDLQPVVVELRTRRDTLRQLSTALGRIATAVGQDDQRLAGLAENLRRTLDSLGARNASVDSVLAQLPDLATELRRATDAVTGLSGQLDPALDNLKAATGKLPGALGKLGDTAETLGTTVDQLGPLAEQALPVVADLRPLVASLGTAMPELKAITARLDPVTGALVKYLPDLGAFITNTRSVTSMKDANSGILRAQLVIAPRSLPTDALNDLSTPTQPGR
jgi:phospholipid/cholesterol/gamma-HCH transport system substrate-binding protein